MMFSIWVNIRYITTPRRSLWIKPASEISNVLLSSIIGFFNLNAGGTFHIGNIGNMTVATTIIWPNYNRPYAWRCPNPKSLCSCIVGPAPLHFPTNWESMVPMISHPRCIAQQDRYFFR